MPHFPAAFPLSFLSAPYNCFSSLNISNMINDSKCLPCFHQELCPVCPKYCICWTTFFKTCHCIQYTYFKSLHADPWIVLSTQTHCKWIIYWYYWPFLGDISSFGSLCRDFIVSSTWNGRECQWFLSHATTLWYLHNASGQRICCSLLLHCSSHSLSQGSIQTSNTSHNNTEYQCLHLQKTQCYCNPPALLQSSMQMQVKLVPQIWKRAHAWTDSLHIQPHPTYPLTKLSQHLTPRTIITTATPLQQKATPVMKTVEDFKWTTAHLSLLSTKLTQNILIRKEVITI
jgi:hypothetical protein